MSDFLTEQQVNELAQEFMEKLDKERYQAPYILKINQEFSDSLPWNKIATGSAYTEIHIECTDGSSGLSVEWTLYPKTQ